jgi:diketogulonate reductase-like aldo/keto reductase
MANFVMIELELGRTFCDLAKNYKNEEKSSRAIGRPWKAARERKEIYV